MGKWIMTRQHADGGISRRDVTAALGGGLVGSLPLLRSTPARAQSLGTLTLGWVKSTTNLAAFASPEFAGKKGLKIESVNFNTAVDISTAMVSGDLNIGLLTPIHLLRSIETKLDFVQICGNSRVDSTIVASKKLELSSGDWAGLKRLVAQRKLRIASSRGSINDLLGIAQLAKNGITPNKDVEISNIPSFAQHPQALRSGDFDMVITIEPLASISIIEGIGTLFSRPHEVEAGPVKTIYVVRRDWLAKNRDKAQAFVGALNEAARHLAADKDAELQAAIKVTGLSPEVLRLALSINQYDLRNGVRQMEEVASIAAQRQYTSRNIAPELASHVDDQFVKAIGLNG
jgi:ABC-type nitrate/sulfonate/bicarbonate transport system substrate-binding protein